MYTNKTIIIYKISDIIAEYIHIYTKNDYAQESTFKFNQFIKSNNRQLL